MTEHSHNRAECVSGFHKPVHGAALEGGSIYSVASMLFRSLSAASQSLASKPRVAVESFDGLVLVRAMAVRGD